MKILHIVGDSKFGGGSAIILQLALMAKLQEHDVDVLTTDATFSEILLKKGITPVPLDCVWRDIHPLRDILGVRRLYRFMREKKYDLVHTHTSKGGFVGRLSAWLAGVPNIVHTVHGFAFHEMSHPLQLHAYLLLERLAAHWCHRIVTVSEFHRHWALQLGIGTDQEVLAIPNGISRTQISTNKSSHEIRTSLGIPNDEFVILSAGRLAHQKGLEYLIRGIPILEKKTPKTFRIVLAGDGPLRECLDELVQKLGVQDRVIFLGFRRDIGNLLAATDIVVLPSLWEGLSIALLEAMAAKKPIITTSIGSNLEVTRNGQGALLVPPKNSLKLVEAIVQLGNSPVLAERYGRKGNELYRKYYTEEHMLDDYKNMYIELFRQNKLI